MQNLGFDLSGIGAGLSTKLWMLQRSYNWQFLMPHNIKGVIGYLVSQYCQDIRFGDYSISDVMVMKYGAQQRFYAGLQTISVISASFVVPVDNSLLKYFYGWKELIIDKEGYYHPKNNYKKTIYTILYDRSGIESAKFELLGAWPRTNPIIDLSYAKEGALRYNIDFSIDSIEVSSLIDSIIEGVTDLAGSVVSKTKGLFGKAGSKTTKWAGTNEASGFTTATPAGTFYA